LLAHERYGRAGDVNHAIEVVSITALNLSALNWLERRDIAVPGVIHDNVETSKCGKPPSARPPERRFHLSRQEDARTRSPYFFTKSSSRFVSRAVATSRSPDFEYGLRNVSAQTARAPGD